MSTEKTKIVIICSGNAVKAEKVRAALCTVQDFSVEIVDEFEKANEQIVMHLKVRETVDFPIIRKRGKRKHFKSYFGSSFENQYKR